ncbi:MAG TPA: Holliday junction branch migration protein RuvA [Gemmatimonadales bacterium]|nr:Holliday junction branch migration protein RuvA [Gemmatimonadales bacterium]
MIAFVTGTLRELHGDTALIETAGGVGYAVTVPLGVLERLPAPGSRLGLYTELVVREDGWSLYGFDRTGERTVFQRLLSASGVGPKLALAVLSTLGAERAVRSLKERDIAALATVPGIGRKKAEKLIVELGDRFEETPADVPVAPGPGGEAVQALIRLGYAAPQAEEATRRAIADGVTETAKVIRHALQWLSTKR